MHDGSYERLSREMLLEKLETFNLLDETRKIAYTFANQAIKNLELLPKTEYRFALEAIPGYMIERNK
jgi:geranylgeranyl pyrophosphate synthase